jgi:hypothetical protein
MTNIPKAWQCTLQTASAMRCPAPVYRIVTIEDLVSFPPADHGKHAARNGRRLMTKPKMKPPIATTPPQKFSELLAWHMVNGTRLDTGSKPGERWRSDLLAKTARCNGASILNWQRGRFVPGERHLQGLAMAFFGSNLSLQEARAAFLNAWQNARLKHRHNLQHIDLKNPKAVRDHLITQLSSLCRALDIPLTGVCATADHLLDVVATERSQAA